MKVLALACLALTANLFAQATPPPILDPATFDPYLGTYEFASGNLIVIARTERRLYAYEPGSERMRGLDRIDDRTWSAGPSLLVFTPELYRVEFVKDDRGRITALRYRSGATTLQAAKSRRYVDQYVTFRNGDVVLAGTLLMPAGKGPHPAIVLGHGSGAQDRNGYAANIRLMADHLARHGIAVLTYDKRGSARSTGDWASASFADLAGDLVAGIRLLRSRADIDPRFVGAGGSSQAGWVVARATTQLPDIAFVALSSAGGSGFTVERQNLYNTEVEMRAAGFTEAQIALTLSLQKEFFNVLRRGNVGPAVEYDRAVTAASEDAKLRDWLMPLSTDIDWQRRTAWYRALEVDFDPLPAWRAYRGPVLGIFGELDAETPVAQIVPLWTEALMSRKGTDFTMTVFKNASHLLFEATVASDEELPRVQRFVPGFYDTVSDWIWRQVRRGR